MMIPVIRKDEGTALLAGESHQYLVTGIFRSTSVRSRSASPFPSIRVVLVWSDEPGVPGKMGGWKVEASWGEGSRGKETFGGERAGCKGQGVE